LETTVFAVSERTALAKTLFDTEKGAAWALEPVIEGKNLRQTGRSRLLTPVFCSDATHHPETAFAALQEGDNASWASGPLRRLVERRFDGLLLGD